jgi:preprotein translocase subunit SecG
MLYGLLVALFTIMCFLLILVILVQKGKSSMGLGSLGGGSQMLFGGSGGQDIFQKSTWVMAALFMSGSLFLGLINKPSTSRILQNLSEQQAIEQNPIVAPEITEPVQASEPVVEVVETPTTTAESVPQTQETVTTEATE